MGLAAIASVGCSIALDFSRSNLPASRDGGALMDVPALGDLPVDAADVMDAPPDASDVPVGMDAEDAADVVDASDASDAMDDHDASDAMDAHDAADATDVEDAADARGAMDADAADAFDAEDAPDAMDAEDAPEVFDAADASDVPADRGDAGPTCDADLARDPLNCGACGRRCSTTPCTAGVCTWCRAPLSLCSGICYDLLTSTQHCGTCSTRCTGSTLCCQGVCRTRCN